MTFTASATLGLAVLLAAPPEAKPKPKFTLGKDTTYITEPLDKDGYVDYETALNERLRGTITPETNAVVLLMQAIGPKPEGKELHADWWTWLGVRPPPAEREYFVSLDEYRRKKNGVKEYDETEYEREQNRDTYVRCRPWSRKDFAIYAEWLDSIDRPLENVAKAALRPDFYGPMVHRPKADDRPSLMGAFQLWTSRIRVICQALCIRAMDKTERKDYEGAWADLTTSFRISRLMRRGNMMDQLIGVATETIAIDSMRTLLSKADGDAKRVSKFSQDMEELLRDDPLDKNIELIDRFTYLDGIQHLHATASLIPDAKKRAEYSDRFFEEMLKDVNANLNRIASIRRLTTRKERLDSFERLRIELKTPKEFSWSILDVVTAMGKPDELAKLEPHRVRRLLGDHVPAFEKISDANDRALQQRRIVRLAFAIAEFKLANGTCPQKLADLAPKYIAAIPDDLFNGKPLVYKPAKDGYLLYSVGANGKDDGGKTFGDEPYGCDDLAIRMPLPKLKRE